MMHGLLLRYCKGATDTGKAVPFWSQGVVGNGQRSVTNSSDSANMSAVIQCCFHTSLLVVDV